MLSFKLARPILIAITAWAVNCSFGGYVLADDAQDNKELKEQMRIMMQQMQELQKEVQTLKQQQHSLFCESYPSQRVMIHESILQMPELPASSQTISENKP